MDDTFTVEVAGAQHLKYVDEILRTIEDAARDRGTGIAKRKPDYIAKKMMEGKAVIAMKGDVFAGFCYVECWEHGEFVANSGLIVKKEFLTTGLAVMKINTSMGYVPVTFSELTTDPVFWKGCENCVNYDVLLRNNFTRCLCTGMLYDPAAHKEEGK